MKVLRLTLGCLTLCLAAAGLAAPAAQATPASTDDASIVQAPTVKYGWVDPSSLNLVAVEPEGTPVTADDVATLIQTGPSIGKPGISPRTNQTNCGTNKSFYRWVYEDGRVICFANAGEAYTSPGIWGIRYLCPGNNQGRTLYQSGTGSNFWSLWRGSESNYDTCYDFGGLVTAKGVQIR